jgi:hypothetical protein
LPQETIVLASTQSEKPRHVRLFGIIAGVVGLFGALGVAGYYVATQTSLFKPAPLDNTNVLSSIVKKVAEINTASYTFTTAIGIGPRDTNAKPFTFAVPVSYEELMKYKRDEDRIRDVEKITSELRKKYNSSGSVQQSDTNNYYKSGSVTITNTKTKASPVTVKKYPSSLAGLSVKTSDPNGVPYVYATNQNGSSYTLAVTFETQEAVDAGNRYDDAQTKLESKTTSKTVILSDKKSLYAYGFSGKPSQPKLFGVFDLSGIESFISSELSADFSISGTMDNSKETPVDAKLKIGGNASLGDLSFSFDAEGIKKGDNYYGIINKMPTYFGGMSQIRGRWILATKEDWQAYGSEIPFDFNTTDADDEISGKINSKQEQAKLLLKIADEEGVVAITTGPEEVTRGEEKVTKYTLSLVKEKLLPFYERATKELKKYGKESILPRDEKTIEYLKGKDFGIVFDYLKSNATFTLWINKDGFPEKTDMTVRYIPTDEARALKGKQININTSVTLKDINKKVDIQAPKKFITIDEMMSEITGKSKEELTFDKQSSNISSIRNALSQYFEYTGQFPATLDELKKKRKDVQPLVVKGEQKNEYGSSFYESTYYQDKEFLKTIPQDLYAKKPFEYTPSGSNYRLTYQIKLPTYTKEKDPGDYYDYDYVAKKIVQKFLEGKNIADKDNLSISATEASKIDNDHDGLQNTLETLFGTNPKKADTDGDGFNDKDEIMDNSNPLGPGKLNVKHSNILF